MPSNIITENGWRAEQCWTEAERIGSKRWSPIQAEAYIDFDNYYVTSHPQDIQLCECGECSVVKVCGQHSVCLRLIVSHQIEGAW